MKKMLIFKKKFSLNMSRGPAGFLISYEILKIFDFRLREPTVILD